MYFTIYFTFCRNGKQKYFQQLSYIMTEYSEYILLIINLSTIFYYNTIFYFNKTIIKMKAEKTYHTK